MNWWNRRYGLINSCVVIKSKDKKNHHHWRLLYLVLGSTTILLNFFLSLVLHIFGSGRSLALSRRTSWLWSLSLFKMKVFVVVIALSLYSCVPLLYIMAYCSNLNFRATTVFKSEELILWFCTWRTIRRKRDICWRWLYRQL